MHRSINQVPLKTRFLSLSLHQGTFPACDTWQSMMIINAAEAHETQEDASTQPKNHFLYSPPRKIRARETSSSRPRMNESREKSPKMAINLISKRNRRVCACVCVCVWRKEENTHRTNAREKSTRATCVARDLFMVEMLCRCWVPPLPRPCDAMQTSK